MSYSLETSAVPMHVVTYPYPNIPRLKSTAAPCLTCYLLEVVCVLRGGPRDTQRFLGPVPEHELRNEPTKERGAPFKRAILGYGWVATCIGNANA